jgi:hypothetical protein
MSSPTTSQLPPPPPPLRERRPRVSLWTLRVLVSAHLAAVAVQPLLAGAFLAGDVDAVVWHGVDAFVVTVLGWAVVGASLGYVVGGGRWWVLPVTAVVSAAEVVQLGLGFADLVAVHVPLGVAIAAGALLLAVWVWSPAARRAR